MTMPTPADAIHVAQLDYYFTIASLAAAAGPVTFACPDPVRFTFSFETGSTEISPGVTQLTWDTSRWSAAVEAELAATITGVCTPIAALLGLPLAEVQEAVQIKRVWTMAPNVQGAGVSSGRTVITDIMTYP